MIFFRRIACAAVLVLLASCAQVAPRDTDDKGIVASAYVPQFELAGRLSVRDGQRGEFGTLRWKRMAASEQITLVSPLGQVVAELTQQQGHPAKLVANNQTRMAATLSDLTQQALGTAVPVHELARWVQGLSGVDEAGGRRPPATQFQHAGWQVEAENHRVIDGSAIPARITAIKGDVVVKLVVDEWKALR
jgi:outer membrane lipoprotein LolB